MKYNPCVFTGALVYISTHDAYIRCNIFYVGKCLIFTEYGEPVKNTEGLLKLPTTDAVIDLNDGVEKKQFIAIPANKVEWTDGGADYVRQSHGEVPK